MPERKVEVKIVGLDQASGAFASAGSALDRFGQKATDTNAKLAALASKLGSIGQRMTIGLTLPLTAAAVSMTKLAMDAVEAENLFEVALGDQAQAARKWSDDLSKSLGLNAVQVRRNLGTWYLMFDAMKMGEDTALAMSERLTQLAEDMTSLYNIQGGSAQAFEQLRAAMSGEAEVLRRYGIQINDETLKQEALNRGLIRQGQELNAQQKVLMRYQLILEQTSKAQGDLARTIESPTNQLRQLENRVTSLSIKMGARLLDTVAPAIRTVNGLIGQMETAWDQMGDAGQSAILTLGALLGAAGPLAMGLGLIISQAAKARAALAMLALGGPYAAAAAAIAIPVLSLPAGLEKIKRLSYEDAQLLAEGNLPLSKEEYERQQRETLGLPTRTPSLAEINRMSAAEAQQAFDLGAAFRKAGQEQAKSPADLLKEAGIGAEDYIKALVEADPAARALTADTEALRLRLVGLQDVQDGASYAIDAAQESYRRAQERVSDLSDALSEAKQRLEDLARPRLVGMEAWEEKIFQAEQAVERAELARLQLMQRGGTHRQLDASNKAVEAASRQLEIFRKEYDLAYAQQLRNLDKLAKPPVKEITYEEAVKQIGATKKEIATLTKQLENAKAAADAQEQRLRDLEAANKGMGQAVQEAQRQLALQEERQEKVNKALSDAYTWLMVDRDKWRGLGDEGIKAADKMDAAVNEMIDAMRKQAEMDAEAANKALDKVLAKYEELKRAGLLDIYQAMTSFGGGGTGAKHLEARQSGGEVLPGQGYWVGERGPEPFFPRVPGLILPHGAPVGGNSVTVQFNAPLIGTAEISEKVDLDYVLGRIAQWMQHDLELAIGQGARSPVGLTPRM